MIVFRGPSTGKALPKPSRLAVPMLLEEAPSKRSQAVSRGNRTRAAKAREKVLAVARMLRLEQVAF